MFEIEKTIFSGYKLDQSKLESSEICQKDGCYIFEIPMMSGKFNMILSISSDTLKYRIIDTAFEEEYTTYKIEDVNSEYVNRIRCDIEFVLKNIRDKFYTQIVDSFEQTERIIKHIKDKYSVDPETPWEDDEYDRVFRNAITTKWFALIMRLDSKRVGLDKGIVELMNIKLDPNHILELVDNKSYLKAYHMNKKHWITLTLDDSIDDMRIFELLEESFQFSSKK